MYRVSNNLEKELQIKNYNDTLILIETAKIWKVKIASIDKGAEQLELSDIAGGNSENGTIILENSLTF